MTAALNYQQNAMNDFYPLTVRLPADLAIDEELHNRQFFCPSRPMPKRVTFTEDEIIPLPSPLDQMAESDVPDLWHSAVEMDTFRKEARDVCRKMRLCEENPTPAGECSMAKCQLTRGLEGRSCLERQRRKMLAAKCIVRAQSTLEPDRLAALARRCTSWAANLAQEEAARDYLRAQSSVENMDDIVTGFKRTLSEEDELFCERRVRQRFTEHQQQQQSSETQL